MKIFSNRGKWVVGLFSLYKMHSYTIDYILKGVKQNLNIVIAEPYWFISKNYIGGLSISFSRGSKGPFGVSGIPMEALNSSTTSQAHSSANFTWKEKSFHHLFMMSRWSSKITQVNVARKSVEWTTI